MTAHLTGISSMATRELLAELAAAWQAQSGGTLSLMSVGGVDAARRVQAGEVFDVVVLAANALAALETTGHLVAGRSIALAHSAVAACVQAGSAPPDIHTEAALQQAVLDAPRIGYSTGPSGVALMALFARWGIADTVGPRCVQAPPGVPVAALVARGEVALGFQQFSELMHAPGITIIGPLPEAVQIITTFSAGLCATSPHAEAAGQLLAFLAAPEAAAAKHRHGMQPA